eukprot:1194805-Prorocentrum_minimum.AAC.5
MPALSSSVRAPDRPIVLRRRPGRPGSFRLLLRARRRRHGRASADGGPRNSSPPPAGIPTPPPREGWPPCGRRWTRWRSLSGSSRRRCGAAYTAFPPAIGSHAG